MVADLKRLLGYNQTSVNPRTPAIDVLSPYNVAEERKRKEDTWSANFNQYQSEYNRMLEKPVLPMRELPSETGDEKIKNMEELLREHAKMRDMDLTIYTPAPTVPPKREDSIKSVIKLKILDEIENVHDEIENVNFDTKMVRFDLQEREFTDSRGDLNEYSSASQ